MAADPAIVEVLNWRGRNLRVDTGAARAASARLRRASSVLDALLLEETLQLVRAARQAGPPVRARDFDHRLVVLAMTLPHIESGSKTTFARALGQTASGRTPTGDERPRLSPARFGALVRAGRARNWDGLARALRRALAILDKTPIDVAAYVRDLLALDDAALRRWAYDYWQTRQTQDIATETDEGTEDAP